MSAPAIGFGSNLGAPDFLRLFTHGDEWAEARATLTWFRLASEHLMAGTEPGTIDSVEWMRASGVGPNTFQALSDVGAFRQIVAWNLQTVLGVGAVKPGTPDAVSATALALRLIRRIHDAGGRVDVLLIDSPFSSGTYNFGQTYSETAAYVVRFCETIREQHPRIVFGLVEGYPTFKADQLVVFQRLTGAAFLALDVDRNQLRETRWLWRLIDALLGRESSQWQTFRSEWARLAAALSVPIVIQLWGQQPDATRYCAQVLEWARQVRSLTPPPHALQVETWARRDDREGGDYRRDIPHNLPDTDPTSHTGLVLQIAEMFT